MKQFKLPVGLVTYTVKFRKTINFQGTACEGLCDPVKKIIWVERRTADPDVMLATFWHEYAHALFFELGHEDLARNESFVEALAQNIARAVRSLPEGFR